MKKHLIFALALSLSAAVAHAGDQPVPQEGAACSDDATLNDVRSDQPLICADGVWRKVVFKTGADGVTAPLFYEGKCAWRYTPGEATTARLELKGRELADICLPAGWRVHMVASDESMFWKQHVSPSMPNMLLVQAMQPGHRATLWVYPSTPDGKVPQKLVLHLRSIK